MNQLIGMVFIGTEKDSTQPEILIDLILDVSVGSFKKLMFITVDNEERVHCFPQEYYFDGTSFYSWVPK